MRKRCVIGEWKTRQIEPFLPAANRHRRESLQVASRLPPQRLRSHFSLTATLIVVFLSSLSCSSLFVHSSEIIEHSGGDNIISEEKIVDNEAKQGSVNGQEMMRGSRPCVTSEVEEEEMAEITISGDGDIISDEIIEEIIGNVAEEDSEDGSGDPISSNEQSNIEQHYFSQEIDFLAKQAMILGNHPDASSEGEIARLIFIEKSLQMELDFIRRLKAMKKGRGDATNPTHFSDDEQNKRRSINATNVIISTIGGATWPNWATPPPEMVTQTGEMDHTCDYDWVAKNGFAWMHERLHCRAHAHSQDPKVKPIYTPDMWRKLWEAFEESTLFPFPIPTSDERPVEPFHVSMTTNGKGRGNFASRRIPKGSLIHAGHPTTVFFLDNDAWFRFVSLLPKMYACDVMEWAWQQDLTESGHVVMCLNMDEAVFFNDGSYDESMNMGMKQVSSLDFYATEDIEEGEEVTYDYSHFEFDTFEMDL